MEPYKNNSDEEINEMTESYGLDKEDAEEVINLRDELGIDDDEAYEIWEAL